MLIPNIKTHHNIHVFDSILKLFNFATKSIQYFSQSNSMDCFIHYQIQPLIKQTPTLNLQFLKSHLHE